MVPARSAEEVPSTTSDDDASSDVSVVDCLHRKIAELQAQLCRKPDAATASSSRSVVDVMALPSMSAALLAGSLPPPAPPAEPTPLLPPAQPSSQDLLANILQQMTTPTTAGEHDGVAGGDVAQFVVLVATLDPDISKGVIHSALVDRQVVPHAQLPFRQGASQSPFSVTQRPSRPCFDYNYRGTSALFAQL